MPVQTNDPILSMLRTMQYEYLNGQSKGGQLIMRPKDRLLRQIKELEEIVLREKDPSAPF